MKRTDLCDNCGHAADWHRLDDADPANNGDPSTWKFRCLGYDCEVGGPVPVGGRACMCPDFVAASRSSVEGS